MTLRWRWTLALLASALVLLGGVTLALELGLRALVAEEQDEWSRSRQESLLQRLEAVGARAESALRSSVASGEAQRVLAEAVVGDATVLRAIADWAGVYANEIGVDEVLLLDAAGTVLSSASAPELAGARHPQAEFLTGALAHRPSFWRLDESAGFVGAVHRFRASEASYLLVVALELGETRLQTMREDLQLIDLSWDDVGSSVALPERWQLEEPARLHLFAGETAASRVLRTVRGRLPWLAGAALLLTLLLSPWLAAGLARPLSRLAGAVGEIGRGSRRPELPQGGPREVRELSGALQQLVQDLEGAEQRIRSAERRGAWREIARRIAHEIRNALSPLSLALDNVETAVEREGPEARQALHSSLSIARDQLGSLRRLVSEFHGFARSPRLELAPFDPTSLIESALEGARASVLGHEFLFEPGATLPPLRGDAEQLRRALHNLLKNAAESAPAEPVILRAGPGPTSELWWISVSDRGPGLEDSVVARLGEPYLTTKPGGTGLGLPLVVQIAEAHGGRLDWRKLQPRGLEMRMVLPVQPVAPPVDDESEDGSERDDA